MADQPSIFESNPANPATPNTPVGSNPAGAQTDTVIATLLSTVKNERGEQKYSTIEAAIEGLRNAQEFIPSLKAAKDQQDAEIARLRVEAERAAELERTLTALTSQREQGQATPAPVLDENKLADLVNQTLTKREQEAKAQTNLQSVVSTLQHVFGADAETKFYGKASELGMTREEINTLASRSPQAVLTMLGVTQQSAHKPNTQVHTPSTVNSAAFTPNQETFIGRNTKPVLIGATTNDVHESSIRAKKMVEELHAKGMSVHDLTDPKVYMKHFS